MPKVVKRMEPKLLYCDCSLSICKPSKRLFDAGSMIKNPLEGTTSLLLSKVLKEMLGTTSKLAWALNERLNFAHAVWDFRCYGHVENSI